MTPRPRLTRSIAYWVLTLGSILSIGFGVWLVIDKITVMTTTLGNQIATGIEVYAGQSWVLLGAAFIVAGLVGLVAVLALAAAARVFAAPIVPVAAPVWPEGVTDPISAEPALAEPTEPVADELPVAPAAPETTDSK